MSIPNKVETPSEFRQQLRQATKADKADSKDKSNAGAAGSGVQNTNFREVMGKIAKEVGEGQRIMEQSMNVRKTQVMDNGQLLAFQAKMYRYTQVLELTGKVVDKGTQSVKYTLQSQQ